MADPKLPPPDEVVEQAKKDDEAKDSGKKYDGGEIPKAPAEKK